MRIFERLQGRSRSDGAVKRRLFKAITDDLLQKLEDGTSAPALVSNEHCCSCCSAEQKAPQ